MNLIKNSFLLIFILCISSYAHAVKIYHCEDANGKKSFQQQPCEETTIKVDDENALLHGSRNNDSDAQDTNEKSGLTENYLQGAWLITEMNGEKDNENDLWEFQDGKFTQNLGGQRLLPDPYTLNGNIIDLNYGKITVLEMDGNRMKAEMAGFIYSLVKQSNKIVRQTKPQKPLSKEQQEFAEGLAEAILENTDEEGIQLNCIDAVKNGKYHLDSMLAVAKENHLNGYIPKEEYDNGIAEIMNIKRNMSIENCNSSGGDRRKFYTCLTNLSNHVASCGKKYDPQL